MSRRRQSPVGDLVVHATRLAASPFCISSRRTLRCHHTTETGALHILALPLLGRRGRAGGTPKVVARGEAVSANVPTRRGPSISRRLDRLGARSRRYAPRSAPLAIRQPLPTCKCGAFDSVRLSTRMVDCQIALASTAARPRCFWQCRRVDRWWCAFGWVLRRTPICVQVLRTGTAGRETRVLCYRRRARCTVPLACVNRQYLALRQSCRPGGHSASTVGRLGPMVGPLFAPRPRVRPAVPVHTSVSYKAYKREKPPPESPSVSVKWLSWQV